MGLQENTELLRTAASEYGEITGTASAVSEQAGDQIIPPLRKLQTSLEDLTGGHREYSIAIFREQATAMLEYADMTAAASAAGYTALQSAAQDLNRGSIFSALQEGKIIADRLTEGSDLQRDLAIARENLPRIVAGLTVLQELVKETLPAIANLDIGYEVLENRSHGIANKINEYLGEDTPPGSAA